MMSWFAIVNINFGNSNAMSNVAIVDCFSHDRDSECDN